VSSAALPLSDVRVLDVATFVAAPFCATMLAEFGADVIKVEHPIHGDPLRGLGRQAKGGETLTWLSEARNKRTMTLDLGKPEGAALFRQLVREADVVTENFRPGTMERWGLGYDALAQVNPRIVMARVSAYGQDGPYKDRPGFARIAHAFSGLTYLAGEAGQRPVIPGSTSLGDYITGLYAMIGVMMALRERERSGCGQYIDVALYESTFRLLDELAPSYAMFGVVRERMGADTATIVPHSHYRCADGNWVALACSSDKMFARLAGVMGRPELASDPNYATMPARIEHRDAVNALVSAWIGSQTRNELMAACIEAEVPCGPINSIADIFADPHFAARGNLVRMESAEAGEVIVPSVLPRLSRTPGRIEHLGRHKGEDTDAILTELLALSADRIAALRRDGIV
jgi:crotonobetainyl-CoA:carnitine CoA-transferase CaiB-like acyl-CoA transferase